MWIPRNTFFSESMGTSPHNLYNTSGVEKLEKKKKTLVEYDIETFILLFRVHTYSIEPRINGVKFQIISYFWKIILSFLFLPSVYRIHIVPEIYIWVWVCVCVRAENLYTIDLHTLEYNNTFKEIDTTSHNLYVQYTYVYIIYYIHILYWLINVKRNNILLIFIFFF